MPYQNQLDTCQLPTKESNKDGQPSPWNKASGKRKIDDNM